METDISFQVIHPNVKESLIEDRVLLRVYYKAGSYQTYQADGTLPYSPPSSSSAP